ncbi:MAG TPA: PHP domain-containing protein [Dehalococcoidia bacterium]|nr:PHP domain-containing protein [Dehalococcoidia bacterium]
MTSRADFHTHTNASDGRLTPSELVRLAASRGLSILAVTDHDSTEGIAEALAAAGEHPGFMLVPGIEMSTDIPGDEIHVLGYFLDYKDPDFQTTLTGLRNARRDRGRMMVEKLHAMGIDIPWKRVEELAGDGSVGRPHVAQALVEFGRVSSFQEAFDRYIGRNGPAYAERAKLTPVEAIEMLAKAGALPVLAHPASVSNLDDLIAQLKAAGMVGIEVYYQDYDQNTRTRLAAAAERHGLLKIGGSDFHGIGGERERLPGDIPLPDEAIDAFMAAARRMTSGRLS